MSRTASARPTASKRPHSGGQTWRAFLKPGWFLAAIAILVFSYFAFTFLAPWQLGKNHDIGERNQRIETAFDIDPVPAQEIFHDDGSIAADDEWRRVLITGHYLPDEEAILRMRPVEGTPAIQALTPFATNFGPTILVNRGWKPAQGAEVPDFAQPPHGEVEIEAVARRDEAKPDRAALDEDGLTQVYGINTGYIGDAVGLRLGEDFVQLSGDDQPGALVAMPIPKLDRGSHLSYGLQWIAFGVMAPAGLAYFIWAELRERRRVAEEEAELEAADDTETAHSGNEASNDAARPRRRKLERFAWDDEISAPPPGTPHQKRSRTVADRYGGSKNRAFDRRVRKQEERF